MSYIKRSKKNGHVYLSEVESKRIDGKVVTKHIRYLGKEANGTIAINASVSDISVQEVKVHGPLIVLHHLAEEINLPTLLGKYGNEILSMVYAHCLNYESVNQMADWFKRTDLNLLLGLEEITESRLLKALDDLQVQNENGVQKAIFNSVIEKYDVDPKGIIYDVTNTYFSGNKCEFAKLGKDKDGVLGRPLIQIGLGVTQKEGIPAFHKIFPGNVHDSRCFQDMMNDFREYGFKGGLLVFDKGMASNKNHCMISDMGWQSLCALPFTVGIKKVVKSVIAHKNFLTLKNRVKLNKTIFYVESVGHAIEDVRGTLHVCFNEKMRRDLIESRYDEIEHARTLISKGKPIKPGLEKFFSSHGKLLTSKLQMAEEFDGYSVIFTTSKLPKKKIVKMYFDKDLVEKAFQNLKGVVRLRPIRHWLYDRVASHVFICYLSYLILTLLKLRLQEIEMSPVKALKELDSLYKVYLKDSKKNFEFTKLVALTRKQEKILKAVDKNLLKQCRG